LLTITEPIAITSATLYLVDTSEGYDYSDRLVVVICAEVENG